jgi:hypothetical protein
MMDHTFGWMGGGVWIWTVLAVVVAFLLVFAVMNKVSNK